MEQKTRDRLENLRSVEPILNALRTIALGNWKVALKRREEALDFTRRIGRVLADIPPTALPPQSGGGNGADGAKQTRVTALVIGSERGLCGGFNQVLAERTSRYLEEATRRGEAVRLQAAGALAARILERRGLPSERLRITSATSLPSFASADSLAKGWLAAYEAEEVDRVEVLYNAYLGSGRYEARVRRLIPPTLPSSQPAGDLPVGFPPILQTDPAALDRKSVV